MAADKPRLYMRNGRWDMKPVRGMDARNVQAAIWLDRRNYFIGVRAGIALGQALDCTARGCPVPADPGVRDYRAKSIALGNWDAAAEREYNPEGWQQPTGQELGYGPYN